MMLIVSRPAWMLTCMQIPRILNRMELSFSTQTKKLIIINEQVFIFYFLCAYIYIYKLDPVATES
jgi:hypothetical protein